jgi:hypothetical protein
MKASVAASSPKPWDDRQKADITTRVIAGTLSVRDACALYGLSRDCIRDWVVLFRRSSLQAFDEHLRHTLASQGLDANGLAGPEFTGTLLDITIADLVQTMALGRKDGVITVTHGGMQSRIWCVAGEIVDAESGRLKGESAVHRILALQQGDVVAEFCAVSRTPSFRTSISGLLLEGARRLDECAVLRKSLGTGALILGSSAMAVGASLQPHEANILRRLDEARCIEDVLSESELGDLETLSTISQLLKKGHLLTVSESNLERRAPAPESSAFSPSLMPLLPTAASLRAAPGAPRWRTQLAGTAFLLSALCAGFWGWTSRSAASLHGGARALETAPFQAPVTPEPVASAPATSTAQAPSSGSEARRELFPSTPPQSVSAAATKPPRPRKPRSPMKDRVAVAGAAPPGALVAPEAPLGSGQTLPRMQIIEGEAPRMQIVQ